MNKLEIGPEVFVIPPYGGEIYEMPIDMDDRFRMLNDYVDRGKKINNAELVDLGRHAGGISLVKAKELSEMAIALGIEHNRFFYLGKPIKAYKADSLKIYAVNVWPKDRKPIAPAEKRKGILAKLIKKVTSMLAAIAQL